jgi:hypothetical protein
MKQYNIPSVSPELGSDSLYSTDFILKYDFAVRDVLKDNTRWIIHTFKKLSGELRINERKFIGEEEVFYYEKDDDKFSFKILLVNTGL